MTIPGAAQLAEKIRDWVIAHRQPGVSVAGLDADTDLIASGILDSVGFVEMLAYAEALLGQHIDLSDIDPEQFTKLGGFCNYAVQQVADSSSTVNA
jgi:acyl carrier protein